MSKAVNNAATQAVESGIFASDRANQGDVDENAVRREAEIKASKVQSVASDAAEVAQDKFPDTAKQTASTTDVLQNDLAEKTDAAAAEGQKDVEDVKAAGATYVGQAKQYAGSILATAQGYLDAGQNKLSPQNGTTQAGGIVPTLQSATGTALGTTKNLLSSAQEMLQPHVENARAAAQPHIDSAVETAQPYVEKAKETVQPQVQKASETVQPHLQKAADTVQSHVQKAKETAQPHVDATADTARPYVESAKRAVSSASDSNTDKK
ncbi:hypothetical protein M0805_007948 [Coniferiporia weirii]|nr:hypothetical protein M0805_007948 [Coniferiporia weirii]